MSEVNSYESSCMVDLRAALSYVIRQLLWAFEGRKVADLVMFYAVSAGTKTQVHAWLTLVPL